MIYEMLNNFLKQAQTTRTETKEYLKKYRNLSIKVSFGMGTPARVPWIAFLWNNQKVSDGIHPDYLYFKDNKKLLLCFGISETNKTEYKWPNKEVKKRKKVIDIIPDASRYKDSYVYKEYDIVGDSLPIDKESIEQHLNSILNIYIETMGNMSPIILDPIDFKDSINNFITAIENTKISFGQKQVNRLCNALLTKPFLILTGNSGTGKTKITQLLAQWLNNRYTILPVGADWTDNRPILGYYNPLTETYQSTQALDLILNATDDPQRPFFLILDEMNLSHVERYFADLLSAMESGESIPLHAEKKEVTSSSGKNIPSNMAIPNNLFVIGTVNVDETTYMFSPKVLDRANVIEFKVGVDEFEQFLESGGGAVDEIEPAPVGSAEGFLALARELRRGSSSIEDLSTDEMTAVKNCLKDVFRILAFTGSEFAYRTAGEIMRYVKLSRHMAEDVDKWTPEVALDEQILQKVLPKLHGSRRQIGALLLVLAKYCYSPSNCDLSNVKTLFENADDFMVNTTNESPRYPESFAKLREMVNCVERDQFVSFIR